MPFDLSRVQAVLFDRDCLAGKRARAQTIGVLCGFGQRAELERAGADLILDRTSQLAEVLW